MITLEYSSNYLRNRRKFLKNNPKKAKAAIKVLSLLVQNPTHPSLHLEKLKNNPVWTIRIDQKNRIFFVWKTNKVVLLIDIGQHDKYRRY